MLHNLIACPWIINIYITTEVLQLLHNVHYFCVAAVWAVLLEGYTQYKYIGVVDLVILLNHQFQYLVCDKLSDRVVHRTTRQNHLWVITQWFRFVCQIVWIHRDTVSTHQTWTILQEVPFATCGFNHIVGINTHAVANQCQLIHKRDIHVALAILYRLRSLCHLHVGSFVSAVLQDTIVQRIHQVCYLWCRTRSDLLNLSQCIHFIAWIDTLWRITAVEILIKLQTAKLLQDRHTILFCTTGINGWLINHQVTLCQCLTNRLTRFQ